MSVRGPLDDSLVGGDLREEGIFLGVGERYCPGLRNVGRRPTVHLAYVQNQVTKIPAWTGRNPDIEVASVRRLPEQLALVVESIDEFAYFHHSSIAAGPGLCALVFAALRPLLRLFSG